MKFQSFLIFSIFFTACGTNGKNNLPQNQTLSVGDIDRSDFGECRQILEQDLFNKIYQDNDLTAKALVEMEFYSLSEEEAWSKYQDMHKQTSSGGGSGNIDILDWVKVGGGGNNGSTLDRSEFSQKFKKAKQLFQSKIKTDNFNSTTSNYRSFRDTASVKGWTDCVTKPKNEARLVCYGFRDSSNKIYIHVIYNGGKTSGSNPLVNLEFPSGNIRTSATSFTLGNGDGKHFGVDESRPEGFIIPVNAQLPDGRTSFTCQAVIPPNKDSMNFCKIQRVRGLVNGWIEEKLFNIMDTDHPDAAVPVLQSDGRAAIVTCSQFKKMKGIK